MYLQRYNYITVSKSGIWRILKRLRLNRLPCNLGYKRHEIRWRRYEKPQPGHRLQVDVKFLERIKDVTGKRYYQFTAIDDYTRLRIMRIYDKISQLNAIRFIDYVLSRLPFKTEVIQTDNGSEFQEPISLAHY